MPLRLLILAFALGTAWLQSRPALPDLRWAWLLPPLLLLPGWFSRQGLGRLLRGALLLAAACASGFLYAAWRAELRLAEALPAAWEGRDIRLLGRVAGLPETTPRGWRLNLAVEGIETPGATVPGYVQITIFRLGAGREAAPRGGDCLTLTARLSRPHGSINPRGFDYEGWLLERGIRAQGYALGVARPANDCAAGLARHIDRWRETMRARIGAALPGQPYAGIVTALAVGDQNAIPDAQWTLFRRTGVTHLMSISGMHVTLLAGLVFALVNGGWRRLPRLALRLPARKAATLMGLATTLLYVALAGFGLPALRTLYMVATVAAVLWLDRLTSPSRVLAAALGVVVVGDPWAVLSPGFWLSFGAVAVLLYAGAGRLAPAPLWLAWLRAQWAVTLALYPILWLIFHEISLVSPLANAFAIPLIGLLAVPLTLAAALLPVAALAQAAHAVVALTMTGLDALSALPQPVWHGAAPDLPALLLAALGVAVLLLPRGIPARWLGVALFLPMLFPRLERPAAGEFRLQVLDVGQGLAVVVRTQNHTLLYDTGPAYASGDEAGTRVVAPYLFAHGIDRLDGLVVSHPDSDHSGGMQALLASHRPRWRLASMPMPGGGLCSAGQSWRWDEVEFRIVHPPARFYTAGLFPENDLSCVLKIVGVHGSALLTGDIERLAELSLLQEPGSDVRADILVVPHHGSGGSSMAPFVAAVRPALAVFSVGHRNRFGHPAPGVLARYRAGGAAIRRTDREGALAIRVGAGGLSVVPAGVAYRRYWQGR